MFDLGIQELIVIFIVALIVFGPKRLPELGKALGKGIAELKRAMQDVKESIEQETREEEITHHIPEPQDQEPQKIEAKQEDTEAKGKKEELGLAEARAHEIKKEMESGSGKVEGKEDA